MHVFMINPLLVNTIILKTAGLVALIKMKNILKILKAKNQMRVLNDKNSGNVLNVIIERYVDCDVKEFCCKHDS